MIIGSLWAGRAFGTNTGNLFLRLDGEASNLSGTLRLNDQVGGIVAFTVNGSFDGSALKLSGRVDGEILEHGVGELTIDGKLDDRGNLTGLWQTSVGAMGTFELFPHDRLNGTVDQTRLLPEQFHTARYNFSAIAIDRAQFVALADDIQADFKNSEVVVTVVSGTEQAQFLRKFKNESYSAERAEILKIFVQQKDTAGLSRSVLVEFGPHFNMAMAQGTDEAWVLGTLEKLKKNIKIYERTYATSFKKMGFGLNQFLIAGAIVFTPSLESIESRVYLLLGVLFIIFGVEWLHNKYLPNAALYLKSQPKGAVYANLASWSIAASSALVAALLAAYLQGRFPDFWK